MLDTLLKVEFNVTVQVVMLVVLLVYFFTRRKDPRHLVSTLSLVRTVLIFLIFILLLGTWLSVVNPTLRTASVLGMCVINLYMLWNVILTRLERPYQDALDACEKAGVGPEEIAQAWHTGKHFYYWRFILSGVFSGHPRRFLRTVAAEQVREQLHDAFNRLGRTETLVSLKTLKGYLEKKLEDETLPPDFKAAMHKSIAEFTGHVWIESQVNRFLLEILDSPDQLFTPEWAALSAQTSSAPGQAKD